MAKPSRGREAVEAALVEAATDLFASEGDPSVRTMAAHAGVNHGLVHHYFGGKSGLRAAVVDRLAAGLRENLEVAPHASAREVGRAALRVTEQDPRMVKILARALLDGELPEQLQSSYPVVDRLLAALPKTAAAERRAVIAEGLAITLGAVVFGSWIAAALGMSEAELQRARDEAIERNLDRLQGETPA